MTTIPPAAATAVAEAVRPVASSTTRMMMVAGGAFTAMAGLALWADHHYKDAKPDANGDSPGYMDRKEARNAFAGADGFPAIVSFTALLAASFLYSHGRQNMTPKEFNMLRTSYWVLGGMLLGTAAAPAALRKLPAEFDPKPVAPVTAPAANTVAGAAQLKPQGR